MYPTTHEGLRTWDDPWAKLIKFALEEAESLIDDAFDSDGLPEFGVQAFDRLSSGQQLYLLVRVGNAFLDESDDLPEPNCCIEATVDVLLKLLGDFLSYELDSISDPPPTEIRRAVLNAFCMHGQMLDEGYDSIPATDEDEPEIWLDNLAEIRGQIMYDSDHDLPFGNGSETPSDYFAWEPREPNTAQIRQYRRALRRLCRHEPRQSSLAFAKWPEGFHEAHRFTATRSDGSAVELIMLTGADQETSPVAFRTIDGSIVWWIGNGKYRLIDTDEELAASDPPGATTRDSTP